MDAKEILDVIEDNIHEMNRVNNKGVTQRLGEMRTVVDQLATLVLNEFKNKNMEKYNPVAVDDIKADISTHEMENGQIGIITLWDGRRTGRYCGLIVQRWGDHLIIIGSDDGWDSWYPTCSKYEDCRVRILPPGTTIKL